MCSNPDRLPRTRFLFEWIGDPSERERRYALADIISFVGDVLALPEQSGYDDDFRLSGPGADGLSMILGAVEQALRFDITHVAPAQEETAGEEETA